MTAEQGDDLAAIKAEHEGQHMCGGVRYGHFVQQPGIARCPLWRLANRAERAERERDIARVEVDAAMHIANGYERERDEAQAKVRAVEELLGEPPVPVYDPDNPNCPGSFEGHANGRRQDHRTVGPHRAWSDAGEWCYPYQPCSWCLPHIDPTDLRAALAAQPEVQP